MSLPKNHPLKTELIKSIKTNAKSISNIRQIEKLPASLKSIEAVELCNISKIDLGKGTAEVRTELKRNIFFEIISESSGIKIENDRELLKEITNLCETKVKYMRIKDALDQVEATGYGIVMPSIEELSLEEPEIMRQGGRYGVRLKASAPSLHIMKANINTEVTPIVGSEQQSEDLVMYLLKEFEENPLQIWESNIFGKSLHELVNEGLHTKLSRMPQEARMRMQETIEKVINEGCSGLICIIL